MAYSNFYAGFHERVRQIGGAFRQFWSYRPSRFYLLVIFIFQAFGFWQAWDIFRRLGGELLVLRYKIDFGANLVGQPRQIFLYPLFSFLVLVFNFLLILVLRKDKKWHLLVQLLLSGAAVFSFFMILYLMSVYLINFR
jgi:hypothetical protein